MIELLEEKRNETSASTSLNIIGRKGRGFYGHRRRKPYVGIFDRPSYQQGSEIGEDIVESYQQLNDSVKSFEKIILDTKSAVIFAAPLFFSTAHTLTSEIKQDLMPNSVSESSERVRSLAEEIATLLNRFEEKVFAYPGTVIEVEKNVSGDATSVLINVSINGKSHLMKKSINQLNFEVQPNMPLVIEGIKRGQLKKLNIKKAEAVSLSNKDLELLKTL